MDQQQNEGAKSPLASKTLFFNSWSALLVPAIWPFLPKSFRDNESAIAVAASLTAWLTIGNIVLRLFTSKAIALPWRKK